MSEKRNPTTLLEVVRHYADEQVAFEAIRDQRWPDGKVTCPLCGSGKVKYMQLTVKRGRTTTRRLWNCNVCRKQFTLKTGTIYEDSPIPFTKWLPAIWLIANARNGVSSCELARSLGVTQKTAWFMLHRIRLAMASGSFAKLSGHVEADETFIGGKAEFMHKKRRKQVITSAAPSTGKSIVMGILERGGRVVTFHISNTRRANLEGRLRAFVEPGSHVFTDKHRSYQYLNEWYRHEYVDHVETYVNGIVHTNGMENYWSLLKRMLKGTYVSVEPFQLFRYLDEQAFRFNERKGTDGERFQKVLAQTSGRRLTYNQLTGKVLAAAGSE